MKKILSLFLIFGLCIGLVGCGNDGSVSSSDDSQDSSEETTAKEEEKEKTYGLGETVTYSEDGTDMINFTINSVTVIDERNEFADTNPAQVVVINYTYENIADDEDVYISSMNFTVVDEGGNVCETYPAGVSVYPQETPKGAKSTGEEAYGLVQQSSKVKLMVDFTLFDETKTTFELPLQ